MYPMSSGMNGGNPTQDPQQGAQFTGTSPEPPSDLYEPNEQVKNILWQRIDFLPPDELPVLDSMVTQENIHIWMKLFPELAELLAQASAIQHGIAMDQQAAMPQPMGMPQPAMQQQMPGGAPMQQQPMGGGLAGQRFG